jgi:hypothetical protein
MLEFLLVVFGILALVAFVGGKVGYRMGASMGAKRAATEIADVFRREIPSDDNDLKSVPALLADRSLLAGEGLLQIAKRLHFAAFNDGMTEQARISEPKQEESLVVMKTTELEDIARLANIGFRKELFRSGERMTRKRAEDLHFMLDEFERCIAPSLLRETEEEKERRFRSSHNRLGGYGPRQV